MTKTTTNTTEKTVGARIKRARSTNLEQRPGARPIAETAISAAIGQDLAAELVETAIESAPPGLAAAAPASDPGTTAPRAVMSAAGAKADELPSTTATLEISEQQVPKTVGAARPPLGVQPTWIVQRQAGQAGPTLHFARPTAPPAVPASTPNPSAEATPAPVSDRPLVAYTRWSTEPQTAIIADGLTFAAAVRALAAEPGFRAAYHPKLPGVTVVLAENRARVGGFDLVSPAPAMLIETSPGQAQLVAVRGDTYPTRDADLGWRVETFMATTAPGQVTPDASVLDVLRGGERAGGATTFLVPTGLITTFATRDGSGSGVRLAAGDLYDGVRAALVGALDGREASVRAVDAVTQMAVDTLVACREGGNLDERTDGIVGHMVGLLKVLQSLVGSEGR